ncbi:hypothetical protein GGR21_003028 [Dysgonomonas hofstadii]|uniref:Lipoprotein n=1 Tax=Dysgonomonas hofstadii TaxID=637886 RepID=A0A840CYU5_9BACT|nr:hypothetical protein [Dysgonomonas hofstadii]MBB4037113.1 hypothetical protein [Dysgonomonas hofstadii]
MKKYIVFIFSCILIGGIITSCGSKPKTEENNQTGTTTTQVSTEPAKDKYKKIAEKLNKEMPMVIPGGLRMDKAEAVSKREFRYKYTFTKEPAVSAEEFIRNTKPALTLGLQPMKDMDDFRKDKIILIYSYHKMDGSLFAEIRLNPEEYTK